MTNEMREPHPQPAAQGTVETASASAGNAPEQPAWNALPGGQAAARSWDRPLGRVQVVAPFPKRRIAAKELRRSSRTSRLSQKRAPAAVKVVFSRQASVAEFLESLLGKTTATVEAALHQINNPRLVRALEEVSQRGVRVRLLLDRTKYEESVTAIPILPYGRIAVRLLSGRLGPVSRMHHKFALLDRRTAVTGSYNWTVGSDEQNYENLVILRGRKEVEAYRREFLALWREGTRAPRPQRTAGQDLRNGQSKVAISSDLAVSVVSAAEKRFWVYLMRHGPAVPGGKVNPRGTSESPLTPEGRKKVSEIARGLLQTGFDVDGIISSPWRHAAETAQIVAARLPGEVSVDCCEALQPTGSLEEAVRQLRKRPNLRRVLMVGHEPGLSRMAARLVDSSEGANLKLKKGGCCLLAFDETPSPGNGRLVWWLPPRLLRRLR
jgi:phosphohistidine phosphatase